MTQSLAQSGRVGAFGKTLIRNMDGYSLVGRNISGTGDGGAIACTSYSFTALGKSTAAAWLTYLTIPVGGTTGQVLKKNSATDYDWSWGSVSGVTTFLGLTDTPSTYSGQANKITGVNAGATALEFKSTNDLTFKNSGTSVGTTTTIAGTSVLDDLSDVNASAPSDGDLLRWDSATSKWVSEARDLGALHVQDQKSAGTNGGTFTSGTWQTRTLTTVVSNTITSATVASNQITLPAGTYDIEASAPAFRVDQHQARLYDTTSSATLLLGANAYSDNAGYYADNVSIVKGRFTLSGTKVLELQHHCGTTFATSGFGTAHPWGVCVYADVFIKKVT